MANNPTLDAMTEIFQQGIKEGKNARLGLVFSIGTGEPPSEKLGDVGVAVPRLKTILHDVFHIGKTVSGLVNLIKQFITQSTQSSGQEVIRAESWCATMDTPYVRLSPPLTCQGITICLSRTKMPLCSSCMKLIAISSRMAHRSTLLQRHCFHVDQASKLYIKLCEFYYIIVLQYLSSYDHF